MAMPQTPRTSTPTEVLAGLVERVTFHNAENGFCVLRVKAGGKRDPDHRPWPCRDDLGRRVRPGDKVMQVENDYDKEFYNGDLGVASRIDLEEGELLVEFEGREVTYGFCELDKLVLAYATKSTRAKARNTRLWSCRLRPGSIRCHSGTWSTRG
jgi:hypothetical protein